jgi:hypothetical protein
VPAPWWAAARHRPPRSGSAVFDILHNRAGPVTEQPHLVLGEKQCSRLTPARQAGRPLGATRSGCLTHLRSLRHSGWTASDAAIRRGRPVHLFTNYAAKVLLAAITVTTIRPDRISNGGAGREWAMLE